MILQKHVRSPDWSLPLTPWSLLPLTLVITLGGTDVLSVCVCLNSWSHTHTHTQWQLAGWWVCGVCCIVSVACSALRMELHTGSRTRAVSVSYSAGTFISCHVRDILHAELHNIHIQLLNSQAGAEESFRGEHAEILLWMNLPCLVPDSFFISFMKSFTGLNTRLKQSCANVKIYAYLYICIYFFLGTHLQKYTCISSW